MALLTFQYPIRRSSVQLNANAESRDAHADLGSVLPRTVLLALFCGV
jgi:hypothetical protein